MRFRRLWGSAIAGAAAFWTVNLVISLTPLAAAYRAALSSTTVPVTSGICDRGILASDDARS